MIYLWLSLLALVFALLGFFLHAFHAAGRVEKKMESLLQDLRAREKEIRAGQCTIRKQAEEIRGLRELRQRDAQKEKENKIPLWKDNLNNILSVLDKIEKENK